MGADSAVQKLRPGLAVTDNLELTRKLGGGGMGEVWTARHHGLAIDVAIKFVRAHLAKSDKSIERFRREARIAASLDSRHVVQTFDHGDMVDGTPYIVMELLRGESLATRLEREARLPAAVVVTLVEQTAEVLALAHDAGVVHRDIKPDNLFCVAPRGRTRSDPEVFIKVLDFGIAKAPELPAQHLTESGAMVGTPLFMSPEQLLSAKQADGQADLWALSVVAYWSLTGQPPFSGETLGAVIAAITNGTFTPVPALSQPLQDFFCRAFARDRDERFGDAHALADGLREAVAAAPVGLSPPQQVPTKQAGADADPLAATTPELTQGHVPAGTPATAPTEHGAAFSAPPVADGDAQPSPWRDHDIAGDGDGRPALPTPSRGRLIVPAVSGDAVMATPPPVETGVPRWAQRVVDGLLLLDLLRLALGVVGVAASAGAWLAALLMLVDLPTLILTATLARVRSVAPWAGMAAAAGLVAWAIAAARNGLEVPMLALGWAAAHGGQAPDVLAVGFGAAALLSLLGVLRRLTVLAGKPLPAAWLVPAGLVIAAPALLTLLWHTGAWQTDVSGASGLLGAIGFLSPIVLLVTAWLARRRW